MFCFSCAEGNPIDSNRQQTTSIYKLSDQNGLGEKVSRSSYDLKEFQYCNILQHIAIRSQSPGEKFADSELTGMKINISADEKCWVDVPEAPTIHLDLSKKVVLVAEHL